MSMIKRITDQYDRFDQQERVFVELANEYEALKERMKALAPKLDEATEAIGVGGMFQDPETNVVYQITQPEGHYVFYRRISYNRTKKEGERAGTLSMKKAVEAGFTL